MGFPQIEDAKWTGTTAGPYSRNMGNRLERMLRTFGPLVRDQESNWTVAKLCAQQSQWRAAHAVFDEIRRRRLRAADDPLLEAQYWFEEACSEACYNAIAPPDPFDESAPFWVGPAALGLARHLGFTDADSVALLL